MLKGVLVVIVAVSASAAEAQDKPFFSAQYPAAGVSLPPTSATTPGQNSVPRARSPRVVSSDDFKGEQNTQAQTVQTSQTARPANLTQYGVDFDKRHPELWGPQPDLETVKQQLDQGQPSPTPSPAATPTPTPSPTPVRIKVDRRVYVINPNATLQPAANPGATPMIIVVQPQH